MELVNGREIIGKNKQGFADAIEENILNGFRSLADRFLER